MKNLGLNTELQNMSISRLESIKYSLLMIFVHFNLVQGLMMSVAAPYLRGDL